MIELGKIRMSATGVKRVLVFQSWPQFASWVAIVALMFGICETVVHLAGLRKPLGPGALFGGIGGALPSLWLARQASFRVRGSERAQAWSVIEGRLCARQYHPPVVEDGVHRFQIKLPRLLRWDEQDIRMSMDRDGMLVTGPYGALLGLRRLLAVTFAD
ncbi:MAG TPA: hypothetical protein VF793_04360 [Telluria sp.]|jgi:hypothetical protein